MWWMNVLAISMVMCPGAWSRSLGTTRVPSYDYSYGRAEIAPFSVPGQILGGITATDAVEASGDLWTAETVLAGASQVCRRIGPDVSSILASIEADSIADTVCNFFESTNVGEECGNVWDELVVSARRPDLVDGSQSLIPEFRCRDRDNSYPSPGDYSYLSLGDYGSSDWNVSYNGLSLALRSAGHVAIDPNQFNPYDPCSEKGIKRVNNIIFALLDWFGPSLIDAFYGRGGEPYAVCGLMRYLLSMNVRDAIERFIGILKFPLADFLETLQPLDICTLIDEAVSQLGEEGAEAVAVAKDLLEEFSGLSEEEFCDFLAEEQTREAYLEQAETIINNVISLIHDELRCNNILDIIAPQDQLGIFYTVTGFNISIESERNEFCSVLVASYDLSSTYIPTPYELPAGVDINDITPFETPGEFLPGLTFVDLLQIDGAGYRAELIIDAIAVECDVFEDLFASSIEEDQFNVRGFCTGARHRTLAIMEEFCLAATVSSYYSEDRPIGLRPFNFLTVNLYIFRVISGIDDISKEEICPAVDRLLTEHSIPVLTNEEIDILLTEAIPAVHGLCQNWEAALCYWKPYCPVPEPATEAPQVEGVTENPWYHFIDYIPDPEYIERVNADFDEIAAGLDNLAWLITGFDSRAEACDFVADAIDPLSGRGDRSAVAVVRDRIIGIVYDVDRCSRIIDASLDLISEEDLMQYFLTGGNTNIVYQFTGYQTSRAFCQVVVRAHGQGGPVPSVTLPPGPGGVATYNVVANIVVHLQRVARSII